MEFCDWLTSSIMLIQLMYSLKLSAISGKVVGELAGKKRLHGFKRELRVCTVSG